MREFTIKRNIRAAPCVQICFLRQKFFSNICQLTQAEIYSVALILLSNITLQGHLRVHNSEKPYPCSQCKKFCSLLFICAHIYEFILGRNPTAAPQWSKSFAQASLLPNLLRNYKSHQPKCQQIQLSVKMALL